MSNNESHKNHHKGYWIPVELDRFGLSNIEKLLLSIIDCLDDPQNHCSASNGYLAEKMGLSISRISFYLTKFKRMGLIEQVSFSGRKRIIRVCKENWYAKEIKNSKKESYVKTSSLPTRFHEVCLRENTHHITKGYNKEQPFVCVDQPPEAVSPLEKVVIFSVEKTKAGGEKYTIERNDIFFAAVNKRKDWTTQEIDDVWETFVNYKSQINDPIAFCDAVIRNKRKLKGLNNYNEKVKKCQKQDLKETQNYSKKETSDRDSWGPHLVDWRSRLGQMKKS